MPVVLQWFLLILFLLLNLIACFFAHVAINECYEIWVEEKKKRKIEADNRQIVSDIKDFIQGFIDREEYDMLNNYLSDLNIVELDTAEIAAYIKVTFPFKKHLPYRKSFVRIAKQEILEREENIDLK